jgi:Flp pilus assembly pilin Flp
LWVESHEWAIAGLRGKAQAGGRVNKSGERMYACLCSGNPERLREENMDKLLRRLRSEEDGQDIAEYAVMLAVILVIVVGTVRLIGGNATNVFSSVSSTIGS